MKFFGKKKESPSAPIPPLFQIRVADSTDTSGARRLSFYLDVNGQHVAATGTYTYSILDNGELTKLRGGDTIIIDELIPIFGDTSATVNDGSDKLPPL